MRDLDVDDDVQVAALAGRAGGTARPCRAAGSPCPAGCRPSPRPPPRRPRSARGSSCRAPPARGRRRLEDELRALALERRVRADVDRDVQRAATPPRGPASPSLDSRIWWPSSMPGGIVDLQRPLALDAALALARLARRLDDPAVALAARAGGDVDHLAEHRVPDAADLAAAVALRAGDRLRCPASAPLPPHVSQRARTGNSISFSVRGSPPRT